MRAAPVIDGHADEAAWNDAALLVGFTQMEPRDGEPSLERTEVRIGYDAKNLYVAFRCFTADPTTIVGAAMNRDAFLENEDRVEIAIDTFLDHQTAFLFATNPMGARVDGTIRDDGEDVRFDWDSVWAVASSRDSTGWTAEFAIPFGSLRFADTDKPVFGINFARFIVKTHELSFWKPLHYTRGIFSSRYRVSSYGEARGFQDVLRGNLFDVKPYVLLGAQKLAQKTIAPLAQGGLDLKVPITSSLIFDLTVNPDFADAEADEQQLNLTRFPLLYPEKREFFKEGQSLFFFGDRVTDTSNETFEQFQFFQSRQIGLAQNGLVTLPVIGGARVTGKIGSLGVGLLNLTTPEVHDAAIAVDTPLYNYSVLRLKQEFTNGSSLGLMALNKQGGDGSYNRGLGADANWVATDVLRFGGYFAKTLSPDLSGDDLAGSADVVLQTEHVGFRGLFSDIGANFRPDLGYLTRPGIRKVQFVPTLTFSPTFFDIKHATVFYDFNYVMDRGWDLQSRVQKGELLVFFNNGYAFAIIPQVDFENLRVPFNIYGDVVIPPGAYNFHSLFFGFGTDLGKPLAAILWLDGGEFWGGTRLRTRLNLFLRPLPGLLFQGIYDRQQVKLPWGDFTSHIASAVTTYSFSPALSTRTTLQYSSNDSVRINALLDWNYMPGANAYLILNEQRDLSSARPWLDNLTIAIKFVYTWGLPPKANPLIPVTQASLTPGSGWGCAAQTDPTSTTRAGWSSLRAIDTCER